MTVSTENNAPFRCDVVGSFLRPDVLKQARATSRREPLPLHSLKLLKMLPFAIWWQSRRPQA